MIRNNENTFQWTTHGKAWDWLATSINQLTTANSALDQIAVRALKRGGIQLIDLVDHLTLDRRDIAPDELQGLGFSEQTEGERSVWRHRGASLPPVLYKEGSRELKSVALRVDRIEEFLQSHRLSKKIDGSPFSRLRRCIVATQNDTRFTIVERHGDGHIYSPTHESSQNLRDYMVTLNAWSTRPREVDDPAEAMQSLCELASRQIERVGVDLAAELFFEAERRYFCIRNRAAQLQRNRQDELGLGWSNHDHHTFRSSRELFADLITFFTALGFTPREKFYAGTEAGWGAQVVENSAIGITLFLDVDLGPEELAIDFQQQGLGSADRLGTIGLWCALHGDSLFGAGLHHLAVLADFDRLTESLAERAVPVMAPFSTLPYLKQAFTEGEIWRVNERRIADLLRRDHLSGTTAERFVEQGVVGSHLEIIQRSQGFKGFEQKKVSSIIAKTDPSRYGRE